MRPDDIFRQQALIDANERVERARRCVESQRAWIVAHPEHPDHALACELLKEMERLLAECEAAREHLHRGRLSRRPE